MISHSHTSILKTLIEFLIKHRTLNLLFISFYTCFIIFMHHHAVQISIYVMNQLTLPQYNEWVKYIGIILGLLLIIFFTISILKYQDNRWLKIILVTTTAVLWLIHTTVMLEMNIEIIHGLMYAILAFLLFAFTGRFAATLMLALLVMLFDEYYQYTILYPTYVQYFELNDVILNILGCCITFTLLIVSNIKPHLSKINVKKKYELYIFLLLLMVVVFGLFSCLFSIYPSSACNNTLFIFNKLPQPELFWQKHSFTQAIYHVVSLWEAVLVISVFFFSFLLLDIYFQQERQPENS